MSKAKNLVSMPNLSTSVAAGTINNQGEIVPYTPSSESSYPSTFYFYGSLSKIANSFYDTINQERKVLGVLFGCNVEGLTCTATVSGYVKGVKQPPSEYKQVTSEELESRTFSFRLVRYYAGDWVLGGDAETNHYAYTNESKTLGGTRDPITFSFTQPFFIRWIVGIGFMNRPLLEPEEHPELPTTYTIFPEDIDVVVNLTLEIPAIPFDIDGNFYGFPRYTGQNVAPEYDGGFWAMDGNFYGFPHVKNSGVAPEYDGGFWTMDGNFYGFPYIKNSGVAPPYQRGFSDLYLGAKNVKNLHFGRMPVKRVYRGIELVFEKE